VTPWVVSRSLINYGVLWSKVNKKFSEELIPYFPFTVILVSDTRSRKKTLARMRNEVNKTIQFGRLQCSVGITDGRDLWTPLRYPQMAWHTLPKHLESTKCRLQCGKVTGSHRSRGIWEERSLHTSRPYLWRFWVEIALPIETWTEYFLNANQIPCHYEHFWVWSCFSWLFMHI
jgi:hypothetical protein